MGFHTLSSVCGASVSRFNEARMCGWPRRRRPYYMGSSNWRLEQLFFYGTGEGSDDPREIPRADNVSGDPRFG